MQSGTAEIGAFSVGVVARESGRPMQHTILIVAGEASADAHGAEVLTVLRRLRPDVHAFGVGGDGLRAAGMQVDVDAASISPAGLAEVLGALPRLWRTLRRLTRLARERQPVAALLIDLPDFNLALARRLRRLGVPVIYLVSPQLWAWRPGRVRAIRRGVDRMLVVLPLDEAFYRARGVEAEYVGHPLVAATQGQPSAGDARQALGLAARQPVVALLPGSRLLEVRRHLPIMLSALEQLVDRTGPLNIVLPVATLALADEIAAQVAGGRLAVTVISGQAPLALAACDVAVVGAGAATLQTALMGRPMVVICRVSWLTYQFLRRLVRVSHVALANWVAGERVAPELIQGNLTASALAQAVDGLLRDPVRQLLMRRRFAALRQRLGDGQCAERVAAHLANLLPASRPASAPPAPKANTHAL